MGECDPITFSERFVREWRIPLSPAAFLRAFRLWPKRIFPGAVELLSELRHRYRIAALTNSNEIHWVRSVELGLPGLFEDLLSSHILGLRKPDPAIFRETLRRFKLSPQSVVFLDDSHENVKSAAALGMRAFHVYGVRELRKCLVEQHLLQS
jgi:putative hydrolase of the HAD superfamily